MGRPSKLDDRQRSEIGRRLAAGERASDLAKEFKVSKGLVSQLFSKQVPDSQKLAGDLASVELAISVRPVSEQGSIRTLADQLKGISSNVALAALAGSQTATRLATLANERAQLLGQDLTDLPAIAALGKTANDAAGLAMGLLNANKDAGKATGQTLEDLITGAAS